MFGPLIKVLSHGKRMMNEILYLKIYLLRSKSADRSKLPYSEYEFKYSILSIRTHKNNITTKIRKPQLSNPISMICTIVALIWHWVLKGVLHSCVGSPQELESLLKWVHRNFYQWSNHAIVLVRPRPPIFVISAVLIVD